MKKPRLKRFLAGALTCSMVLSTVMVNENVVYVHAREAAKAENDWEKVSAILDQYPGIYDEDTQLGSKWDTLYSPDGPLMGNGTVYAFMAGDLRQQNLYISHSNMWQDRVSGNGQEYTTFGGITIETMDQGVQMENIALNKPVEVNSYLDGKPGSNMVDGTDNNWKAADKAAMPYWAVVDLGEEYDISRWVVKTQTADGSSYVNYNVKDFELQYLPAGTAAANKVSEPAVSGNDVSGNMVSVNDAQEGMEAVSEEAQSAMERSTGIPEDILNSANWIAADTVIDNKDGVSDRNLAAPIVARYVRLFITKATQDNGSALNIRELELYQEPKKDGADSGDAGQIDRQEFRYIQDMKNAEVTAKSKDGFTTESWLSAKENILVTQIKNVTDVPLNMKVSAWTANANTSAQLGADGKTMIASKTGVSKAKDRPSGTGTWEGWNINIAMASQVLGVQDAVTTNVNDKKNESMFKLAPNQTVTVVSAIEGGKQEGSENTMEAAVQKAADKLDTRLTPESLNAARQTHQEYWKEYWLKSYIDIQDEAAERMYYGMLYQLGCATSVSSENNGGTAAGLYPWTAADHPKWQGDYTTNTDFQRQVHPLATANRTEGVENYLNIIKQYWPEAQRRAESVKDLNWVIDGTGRPSFTEGIEGGALFPTHMGPWGASTEQYNSKNDYFNSPADATSVLMPVIKEWKYTLDEELLADLYPLMKSVSIFWENYVICENGKYVVYGATHEGVPGRNPILDVDACKYMLRNTILAASELGIDADKAVIWQDILDHMSDVPTFIYHGKETICDVEGRTQDDPGKTFDGNPVTIQSLYYFDSLGMSAPEEEKEKYINYLNVGNGAGSHRRLISATRLGCDINTIMEILKDVTIDNNGNGPSDWFGIRGNNSIGDIGRAASLAVVQDSLLQSNEGFINIFANWYDDQEASFRRLRAENAFLVDADQNENGQVTYASIYSEKGRDCSVINPWPGQEMEVYQDGVKVDMLGIAANALGTVYTFETKADSTYELRKGEEKEETLKLSANTLKLNVGDSQKLNAKTNVTNAQITWKSSDEKVVTVENDGSVKAVNEGSAVITVYVTGTQLYAQCKVAVVISADEQPRIDLVYQPMFDKENGYNQPIRTNGNNAGNTPITLFDGKNPIKYGRGIGMHALKDTSKVAKVSFDISEFSHNVFRATVGVDYNNDNENKGRGTCEFKVFVDGVEVADSGVRHPYDPEYQLAALIPEGAETLTLAVTNGGDGDACDWADWVDPRLEKVENPEEELAEIAVSPKEQTLYQSDMTVLSVKGKTLSGRETEVITADCTFTSSNEDVAAVDAEGKITATGCGEAVITVTHKQSGLNTLSYITVYPAKEKQYFVTSPSGNIEMQLMLQKDGGLEYLVYANGNAVIEPSKLGLQTSLGDFDKGLTFKKRIDREIDETYKMVSGKKPEYQNTCKEAAFTFEKEGTEEEFEVIVRAYDDGIAYRYGIKGEAKDFTISSEQSTFQAPDNAVITWTEYQKAYEKLYQTGKIADIKGKKFSMPFLYQTTKDDYVLITEAALSSEYCGSLLTGNAGGRLDVDFVPEQSEAVKASVPWVSPWRTAIIGGAKEIVENTMTENLSPESKLEDTSWIKPGTTAWTWNIASNYTQQNDPEMIKEYIDHAADFGWEYYLLDEGWQGGRIRFPNGKEDLWWSGIPDWLPEMVEYADSKGIKLMAWIASNDLNTPERREFIKELADLGIVGVKIDFFEDESQEGIKLYEDIYEECARNKMMVDIHGCNKPTGERRTWPNVLTREGVRGQEFGNVQADHDVRLVYTRAAVGPTDFNPFINLWTEKNATVAHKAALNLIYETGLQCPSDKAETYKTMNLYSLMKDLPATWDESIFLGGDPESHATIARRNGESWYVSSICSEGRSEELSLDFLGDGTYTAYIYKDGVSQGTIDYEIQEVTRQDKLTIPMKKNGGYVVKVVTEKPGHLEKVEMDKTEVNLRNADSEKLEVKFMPNDSKYISMIEWSSSNDDIVSVDQNGVITANKLGTAYITAKVTIPAVGAEESMETDCKVTAARTEWALTEPWIRENPTSQFKINSKTSVTMYPQKGEVAGKDSLPKNTLTLAEQSADQNFELTVKCDFDAIGDYHTSGISVVGDGGRFTGIWRRYHKGLGGNVFDAVKYDKGWSEPTEKDKHPSDPAWLKLKKEGTTYEASYSYDSKEWVLVGTQELDLTGTIEICLSTCAGGTKSDANIPAVLEDFTYNGEIIPFAVENTSVTKITKIEKLKDLQGEAGADPETWNLPECVKAELEDGTETDIAVAWDYSGFKTQSTVYTISGRLEIPDGLISTVGETVSVKVTVDTVEIQGIQKFEAITVQAGTAFEDLELPGTAEVTLDNGMTEDVAVIWNKGDYSSERPGICSLTGILRLPAGISNSSGLTASIKVRVQETNKEDLRAMIAYAETQKENENYKYVVPKVKKAFEAALEAAVAVADNPKAQEDQVLAAYQELLKMTHMLSYTGNSDNLKVLTDAAAGLNQELYTSDSVKRLNEALKTARDVLENENALQDEIDVAVAVLQEAMDDLVLRIDRAALGRKIQEAEAINLDKYLSQGKAEFSDALQKAKDIYAKEDAEAEDIKSAYDDLQKAIMELREKPDKSKLEALLVSSRQMEISLYTDASAGVFTRAMKKADAVMNNPEATQKEVDAAEEQLNLAVQQLEKKPYGGDQEDPGQGDEDGKDDGNGGKDDGQDGNDYSNGGQDNGGQSSDTPADSGNGSAVVSPKTGDNAHTGMMAAVLIAGLGISAAAMRKKRRQ